MLQLCPNVNTNNARASKAPAAFQSRIVIPEGQPFAPEFSFKPAQPQTMQLQSIRYDQAAPYINRETSIFKPVTVTANNKSITPMPEAIPTSDEPVVIYKGPLRSVTPQITPIEQFDNDIEKDTVEYFKRKRSVNNEINKALSDIKKEKPASILSGLVKFFGVVLVGLGIYKYRHKLPLIKNFLLNHNYKSII